MAEEIDQLKCLVVERVCKFWYGKASVDTKRVDP